MLQHSICDGSSGAECSGLSTAANSLLHVSWYEGLCVVEVNTSPGVFDEHPYPSLTTRSRLVTIYYVVEPCHNTTINHVNHLPSIV